MHRPASTPEPFPVLFIAHGSPDILLRNDPLTTEWRDLADTLPRPSAILIISAHWETTDFCVGGNRHRETIHDFHGFPEPLYRLRYACPSAVTEAEALADRLGLATDHDRGLDHGAWVPLLCMYPDAQVPVMQLSVASTQGPRAHLELGRRLSFLREQGVFIIASGVLVHNLARLDWRNYLAPPSPWAKTFLAAVDESVRGGRHEALLAPHDLPEGQLGVPTMEHYLPLLVACGAARNDKVVRVAEGWRYANLSMHGYLFG